MSIGQRFHCLGTKDPILSNINISEELKKHYSQPEETIDLAHAIPVWGDSEAPITIVEFSDFECPYCRRAAFQFKSVLWEYRKVITFYFVNYPLDKNMNPYTPSGQHFVAGLAAKASICAEKFGDFSDYHYDIFNNQDRISRELLLKIAVERGWEKSDFEACLDSEETIIKLKAQIELSHEYGIKQVPTIFLNGRHLKHWYNPDFLRTVLEIELANKAGGVSWHKEE